MRSILMNIPYVLGGTLTSCPRGRGRRYQVFCAIFWTCSLYCEGGVASLAVITYLFLLSLLSVFPSHVVRFCCQLNTCSGLVCLLASDNSPCSEVHFDVNTTTPAFLAVCIVQPFHNFTFTLSMFLYLKQASPGYLAQLGLFFLIQFF